MIRSADGLDSAVADSEMAARWPFSKRQIPSVHPLTLIVHNSQETHAARTQRLSGLADWFQPRARVVNLAPSFDKWT
jgi:hypothetical protein